MFLPRQISIHGMVLKLLVFLPTDGVASMLLFHSLLLTGTVKSDKTYSCILNSWVTDVLLL